MELFDQFNRPIDTGRLKNEQSAPTPVLRSIYNRLFPEVNLTPEKLVMIHRQADFGDAFMFLELAETFEENDPHYLAVLNKRKFAVSSLEISVEAASLSKGDQKIADFVRNTLLDQTGFNLREYLFDIMDALGKGFSVNEIIWDTERRMSLEPNAPTETWWVPLRLEPRDPRWFMMDWISGRAILVRALSTEGPLIELRQKVVDSATKDQPTHAPRGMFASWNEAAARIGIQPLTQPLAPWKYVTHFGRVKSGLPIRSSFARCASWTLLFRNYAMKDWAAFAERFGMPIRVGKYPAGATPEDRQALLAAVAGLGSDTAGVIPQGSEIIFQAAQGLGKASGVYSDYLEYLENLVSKIVLGSTLGTQLGQGSGSRAAAQVHRGVELDIIQADGERLAGIITRDLIKPLVDLNFGPQHKYPLIKIGVEDDEDSEVFVKNMGELADRGVPIGVSSIYTKIGISAPQAGEEILKPKQTTTATLDENGNPTGGAQQPGNYDDRGPNGYPGTQGPNHNGKLRPPPKPAATSYDDRGPNGYPLQQQPKNKTQTGRMGGSNPPSQRGPMPAQHARELPPRLAARHDQFGHPADVIADFATKLGNDWEAVAPSLLDPVLQAATQASSYDDFNSRLDALAESMDPNAFEELLERALTNTWLAGMLTEYAGGAK